MNFALLGRRGAGGGHVATTLSTFYSFYDPAQKCRQFRRNQTESVWACSPVLLQ
jgi:hypothetical protein